MGMLMHHTWLNQQKAEKADVKPMKEPEKEPETPVKTDSEPARKTAGRRKASK